MAQMLQPSTATPPIPLPEPQLLYNSREAYFEDFKILEKKILKDVGEIWKEINELNVIFWKPTDLTCGSSIGYDELGN